MYKEKVLERDRPREKITPADFRKTLDLLLTVLPNFEDEWIVAFDGEFVTISYWAAVVESDKHVTRVSAEAVADPVSIKPLYEAP